VKEGSDARIQLEVALLKAARPRADASVDALLLRIEQLERGLGPVEDMPIRAERRKPPKKASTPAAASSEPATEAREPASESGGDKPSAQPVVGIETLWPAVLDRIREGDGGEMLGALLADARPAALEDDVLVLVYPQSASFSKRKIEDAPNGERLVQALKLVAGRPLAVRIELRELEGDEDAAAGLAADPATEDHVIESIKNTFDAEDLSEEPAPEDVPERSA
jgi:hypothetical protein